MITFLVEDGSGLTGATSYASVEDADAYATFWDHTDWLALDEADKQKALIKATTFMDTTVTYPSRILKQEQGLLWPRLPFKDLNGRNIEGLPSLIVESTIRLAILEPFYDLYKTPKTIVSESYGSSRVTYLGGHAEYSEEYQTIMLVLQKLDAIGLGGKGIKQATLVRG